MSREQWIVRWHGMQRDGASRRQVTVQYPVAGRNEHEARAACLERMRREGVEPDGVPEILRADPEPRP